MLIDRIDLRRSADHLDLGTVCAGCGAKSHDIDLCPNLHFMIDQLTLIRKHIFSRDNERLKFTRGTRRRYFWCNIVVQMQDLGRSYSRMLHHFFRITIRWLLSHFQKVTFVNPSLLNLDLKNPKHLKTLRIQGTLVTFPHDAKDQDHSILYKFVMTQHKIQTIHNRIDNQVITWNHYPLSYLLLQHPSFPKALLICLEKNEKYLVSRIQSILTL